MLKNAEANADRDPEGAVSCRQGKNRTHRTAHDNMESVVRERDRP